MAHRVDDWTGIELRDVDMLDRGREQLRLAGVVDPLGVLDLLQSVSFHFMLQASSPAGGRG
jgi:hypothetical protein